MDKCREEFEKHYLNLPFHDSKAAQKCLDSCDFDVKQNVYIPNAKWFDDNDADEGVIYCCMLNTAYMSFQHQQAKVEELQKRVDVALKLIESWNEIAFDKTTHWTEGYEEGCYHCAAQLEQALKGEGQ